MQLLLAALAEHDVLAHKKEGTNLEKEVYAVHVGHEDTWLELLGLMQ